MTSSDRGQDATRHLREVIAARQQAAAVSYTAPPRPETPTRQEAATQATPAVTPLQTSRQTQATASEHAVPPRKMYDTTIAKREDVGQVVVLVLRVAMLSLYPLSLIGSIMAFNGGWDGFGVGLGGLGVSVGALIAGSVIQFVLSGVQIWRGATWQDAGYLAALAVDVGFTMGGYWPMFGESMTTVFTAALIQLPAINGISEAGGAVAFLIMLIGAVLIARLPEQTLFK